MRQKVSMQISDTSVNKPYLKLSDVTNTCTNTNYSPKKLNNFPGWDQ